MINVALLHNIPFDRHVISVGVIYSYYSSLRFSGNVPFTENEDTVLYMISLMAFVSKYSMAAIQDNFFFMEDLHVQIQILVRVEVSVSFNTQIKLCIHLTGVQ